MNVPGKITLWILVWSVVVPFWSGSVRFPIKNVLWLCIRIKYYSLCMYTSYKYVYKSFDSKFKRKYKFWFYSEYWSVFSAGRVWQQALQVCCDTPPFVEKTIPMLSSRFCIFGLGSVEDELEAGNFAWVYQSELFGRLKMSADLARYLNTSAVLKFKNNLMAPVIGSVLVIALTRCWLHNCLLTILFSTETTCKLFVFCLVFPMFQVCKMSIGISFFPLYGTVLF